MTRFIFVTAMMLAACGISGAQPQSSKPKTETVKADPNTWTQWRGNQRDGIIRDAQPWPEDFKGLKVKWKAENLGPSYSGPIIAADRIFTTATIDKKIEQVTALDRITGKEIWKTEWEGAISVPFFAAANGSWIRATPAYDGETLFVAGINDLLVALDAKTGKEKWKFNFVKEFATASPAFGFVCSPLVDASGVYVQAGGCFAKHDKQTGKVIWKSLQDGGGMNGSAFSSPVFATIAGKDQVLVQTRTQLAGVDRDTGAVIWKKEIPSFRGMNILTPIPVGDDGIFTSTYGGNTQLLKVKSNGGNYAAESGWSVRYEGNMTTPVVVDGHAYFLGKDQKAICVNLITGKETWRTDKRFGKYWNLVANGKSILALDERGILFLLKANPTEFDVIAETKVGDGETWAHIAIAGDQIAVRSLTSLTLLTWTAAK